MISVVHAEGRSGVIVDLLTGYSQLILPSASKVSAHQAINQGWGSYRFGLGYTYYFTPHVGLGLEIGRGDYASTTYHFESQSIKIHDTTAEFTLRPEINLHKFTIYSRLGGTRTTASYSSKQGTTIEQRQNVLLGLGVTYAVSLHINIAMDYQHDFGAKISDITNPGWKAPAFDSFMVGILIRFFPE